MRVQYSFRLNGFRFSEPEPPSVYRLPLEDGTFYMFYTPCASSRFTPFTFYSEFTCKAKCKMIGVFHCKITVPDPVKGHPLYSSRTEVLGLENHHDEMMRS